MKQAYFQFAPKHCLALVMFIVYHFIQLIGSMDWTSQLQLANIKKALRCMPCKLKNYWIFITFLIIFIPCLLKHIASLAMRLATVSYGHWPKFILFNFKTVFDSVGRNFPVHNGLRMNSQRIFAICHPYQTFRANNK